MLLRDEVVASGGVAGAEGGGNGTVTGHATTIVWVDVVDCCTQ